MAKLTDEQLAALVAEVRAGAQYKNADGTLKTAREIATLLTTRSMIPNPTPAGQVPATLDVTEVMALVSAAHRAAIDFNALVAIRDAIQAQDTALLGLQMQIALDKGWIDATEAAALNTYMQRTVADPAWQAEVVDEAPLVKVTGVSAIGEKDAAFIRASAAV